MFLNCDAGELFRVPWTARRSNQSILKEINPEYSLEGLMLKLKLQYFGHLMQRTDSLEKTLLLGKIEDKRRRGWQSMRWLDVINRLNGHEFEQAPGVGDGQGSLTCCNPWGCKGQTQLSNWTEHYHKIGLPWWLRDFLGSSAGKESTCNAEDLVWFLGQEDPLEKG